jgi:hypothetical protein
MVQAMEAWFHADHDALQRYCGQGFRAAALSQQPDVESIPKADLTGGMQRATTACQKGQYSKADHSFEILARIDPARVRSASRFHAERFLNVMDRVCTP